MGDYYINGHCVDFITYAQAVRRLTEGLGREPTITEKNQAAVNRHNDIRNRCVTISLAEGAD
jgi:hypothetical protein